MRFRLLVVRRLQGMRSRMRLPVCTAAQHFFEAHPDGLDDCVKCHVMSTTRLDEFAKDSHQDFATLVNCSTCHKVDAEGFDGFKTDWHSAAGGSEG